MSKVEKQQQRITGAEAILLALEDAGVTHMFVNLGSDHPAFMAAFSGGRHAGLRVVTSPNEMNALSAASGFAQITGRPAAVLVHVECGTLGLGAAVHNISRGRIPVFIFAGTSPITMENEMVGGRNEYIHFTQDVPNQREIVSQYMKYDHEIRSPHNAVQLTLRALQFATTSPQGPTYLIASREALEAETTHPLASGSTKPSQRAVKNLAVQSIELGYESIKELANVLATAKRPLIITSYCGRSVAGFEALKELAEYLTIPVHECAPTWNNFDTTSFLHQGHQWNGGGQLPELAEADVVLVVDSDIPFIPVQSKPRDDALVFHLDSDPLKTSVTLWGLPCEKRWQCESSLALSQITAYAKREGLQSGPEIKTLVEARIGILKERFDRRKEKLLRSEELPEGGSVTVPYFMSQFRRMTEGLTIVGLNESTTNLPNVADHLGHSKPQNLIGSGGGGLGWYSGAAVGAYMGLETVHREKDLIVAFVGDGTWLFGVPASAYWMAMKYGTPYLTIIWNNGGWKAPRGALLRVHGHLADKENLTRDIGVGIDPSPDFGKIAEGAGNAWSGVVRTSEDVEKVLKEAISAVRKDRRCAVLEVVVDKI